MSYEYKIEFMSIVDKRKIFDICTKMKCSDFISVNRDSKITSNIYLRDMNLVGEYKYDIAIYPCEDNSFKFDLAINNVTLDLYNFFNYVLCDMSFVIFDEDYEPVNLQYLFRSVL